MRRGTALMLAATAGMALTGVAIAACAGPLSRVGERAAEDLLDPREYRAAVLGEEGRS
jgi:multicomponent Na+:H+ antiporter subunit D